MKRKRKSQASVSDPGTVNLVQGTDGDKVISWIEKYCRIPEGKYVGHSVVLRPWQRDIVKTIYDSPTRTAIITFGRKNAKTTFSAFLLLFHLCGPRYIPNSQLYSSAQSKEQAAILFSLAAKMVRLDPDLSSFVIPRETTKHLVCPELGTIYKALSAEVKTSYGLSPVFTVHDELGQVQGPKSDLYDALETATSAHEKPLSIIISTQAPTDNDLLSILIDDARKGGDKKTKLFIYEAEKELDPFAEETIRKANPAFGDFQNADEIWDMAEKAKRMPSMEASYRNLVLNQRVETSNPFVSQQVWESNAGAVEEDWSDLEVLAGLDLGATNDLTAFVPVAVHGDLYHVKPVFWLPEAGLRERSREDRVPYDVWHRQGFIQTTPGASIEYKYVATVIYDFIRDLNVRRIGFDRWGMRYLKPWLLNAGLSEEEFDTIFIPFGQGFQSMSPALRELESVLLNKRIRHGDHPVLKMCAANCTVKTDEAGGRKLDKKRSHGRIDGMVALAMAVSLSSMARDEDESFEIEYSSGDMYGKKS